MQTKEILSWLKLFIVSFVIISLVWLAMEKFASGYLGVAIETPLENIALYAGLIAIVVATAQWVLNPKPKTSEDMARERMAEAGNVMPAYEQTSTEPAAQEDAFEPSPPVAAKRRAKPVAKKKPAAKKGRR